MNGRRVAALAAGLLAIVVIAIAVQFGSTVAGGSDSYGYVSQAGLWRAGQLTVDQDLAARVPGRSRSKRSRRSAIVPPQDGRTPSFRSIRRDCRC